MINCPKIPIRSSAAEYPTFVAATGEEPSCVELRYEGENLWLTPRMIAELHGIGVRTINEPIQKIYDDNELTRVAAIRNFRIVQPEGFREASRDLGRISAELAKGHTESEREKYRIVQDRFYTSDFDRFLQLEARETHDKKKGGKR